MTDAPQDPRAIASRLSPAMADFLRGISGEVADNLGTASAETSRVRTLRALESRGLLQEVELDALREMAEGTLTALGRSVRAVLLGLEVPDPVEPTMADRAAELTPAQVRTMHDLDVRNPVPLGSPEGRALFGKRYVAKSSANGYWGLTILGEAVLRAAQDSTRPDPYAVAKRLSPAMTAMMRAIPDATARDLGWVDSSAGKLRTLRGLASRGLVCDVRVWNNSWGSVHDPRGGDDYEAVLTALGRSVRAVLLGLEVPDPVEPTMADRAAELTPAQVRTMHDLDVRNPVPPGSPEGRALFGKRYVAKSSASGYWGLTDLGRSVLEALPPATNPAPEPVAAGQDERDPGPWITAWNHNRMRMGCGCPGGAIIWTSLTVAQRQAIRCEECGQRYAPLP